ncbi:MAG TPA: hypothetical protein VGC41_29245, partial [Kofleriaceae bacterium]
MKRQLSIVLLVAACGGSSSAPVAPALPPVAPSNGAAATEMQQPAPPAAPPAAVGHPKDDLIPRTALFGNPDRANVQISPDGKQLSWLAAKDGVLNVWVAPIGKLDQAKAVTSDTKRPVRSYTWAYTSKHLIYSQDAGGDENFHLFRVDLGDGKITDLTPYDKATASIAGNDETTPTKIAIQVNDRDPKVMDLYSLDLVTGKRTMVAENDDGFAGYTLDLRLRPRIATKMLPD